MGGLFGLAGAGATAGIKYSDARVKTDKGEMRVTERARALLYPDSDAGVHNSFSPQLSSLNCFVICRSAGPT